MSTNKSEAAKIVLTFLTGNSAFTTVLGHVLRRGPGLSV